MFMHSLVIVDRIMRDGFNLFPHSLCLMFMLHWDCWWDYKGAVPKGNLFPSWTINAIRNRHQGSCFDVLFWLLSSSFFSFSSTPSFHPSSSLSLSLFFRFLTVTVQSNNYTDCKQMIFTWQLNMLMEKAAGMKGLIYGPENLQRYQHTIVPTRVCAAWGVRESKRERENTREMHCGKQLMLAYLQWSYETSEVWEKDHIWNSTFF